MPDRSFEPIAVPPRVEAREVRQRIEDAQPTRPDLRATVIARAQAVAREQAHAPADERPEPSRCLPTTGSDAVSPCPESSW
jgi:hypothetical protein